MMAKFVNLLAVSTLAILATSFDVIPGVNALQVENNYAARHLGSAHHRAAKRAAGAVQEPVRKRDNSKRCKPKSPPAAPSHAPASTPASAAPKQEKTPAPKNNSSGGNSSNSNNGGSNNNNNNGASASKQGQPKPSATPVVAPKPAPNPAPAANASSKGASGNGKRCLAWSNNEAFMIPQFVSSKVTRLHNWKPKPDYGMNLQGLALDYIPTMWSDKDIGTFTSVVKPGYAKFAMAFNEPDIPSQSNMDPGYAAQLWNKYFCPLKSQGYQLYSPSTAAGTQWMHKFVAAGLDCQWDILNVHVYTTSVQSFQNAVSAYKNEFNSNRVAVTEFACQDYSGKNQQPSADEIQNFMYSTMGWMDSQDWVESYCWFAPMKGWELQENNIVPDNAFITDDNKLTALANFYVYG